MVEGQMRKDVSGKERLGRWDMQPERTEVKGEATNIGGEGVVGHWWAGEEE